MDFGFQARAGTAPALTSARHGRSTRTGRPTAGDTYRHCEQLEDGDEALGLPKAPVFRSQRRGKGATRATKAHGFNQPRAGWGKRHSDARRYNDGIGPMPSTRPVSRQALSDMMDLDLTFKDDTMGKHGEPRPQKDRHHPHTGSGSSRSTRKPAGGEGCPSTCSCIWRCDVVCLVAPCINNKYCCSTPLHVSYALLTAKDGQVQVHFRFPVPVSWGGG